MPATSGHCWPASKKESITAPAPITEVPPAAELAPGLWRLVLPIPGHTLGSVNLYLIRDADGFALVDSGMDIPSCRQALEAHLQTIGLPLAGLHTIVATHGHPDHAGLGPVLRQQTGAELWLHHRDLVMVGPGSPVSDSDPSVLAGWLVRYGFPESEAREASKSVDDYAGETREFTPDRLLEGGEVLAVGPYRFEIVPTPGHTLGHVCLYEPNLRLLLSGDHIFGQVAPNVRLMPYSPIDIMEQYFQSLRAVAALGAERALPAHHEPFEQPTERAEQLIRHQLKRRDGLLALLTDRPQTPYQLASQVWSNGGRRSWADFHGRLRRNAALTLAAHLELLSRDGKVRREENHSVSFAAR